ncbi:MAG TPA: DUF4340 domain-containing protein [Cytophagaceae bacterium]|nr:DUF4340 domain-containing protein [Cytophagaceae bacterium]
MKQPNRIKILFLLFVFTGLGAALVLFKNTDFGKSDSSSLKVAIDSSSLQKVTLRYDSLTTVLTKGNQNWMLNGKYKARTNLTQLMILGLSKAEVKRPVAEENKQKVADQLRKSGIRVTAEGDGWKKTFLLSSNDNDANSSYYMDEQSSEPYVIYVPGFSGDMANLFKMDEAGWRNRELFTSTPLSLQKITVSYPAFKASNVEIRWNPDKTFDVVGVKKVDSAKVITYLSQFDQVNIDHYIYKDKVAILQTLRKNAPQAIIEVSDLDPSANHKLSVYGESKEPKGIYAIIEPGDELVTMKPETLFRLLVRKEFFEKKK